MGRRRHKYRNGRDTLLDIDKRAYKMREDIEDFSKNISRIEQDLEELDREEAEIYLRLAEVRIDLLDDPELANKISVAEREASSFISERSAVRDRLDRELRDNRVELESLEKERQTLHDALDEYCDKAVAAKALSQKKLDRDKGFLDLLNRIDGKRSQIERIENKITLARADYQKKSKPYHDDELFVYLKERHYGRADYKASTLISTLDECVAGLVGYEEARRNYDMLLSIPGKLVQHQQLLERQLQDLERERYEYIQDFYKKDGTFESQKAYLDQKLAIDEIDQELRELAAEQDQILRKKTRRAERVDDNYAHAISTLKNLYQNKSLESLRHYAALSASQADDDLVSRLTVINKRRVKQKASLKSYARTVDDLNKQYQRLETARSTYKHKGYDSRLTKFDEYNLFGVLLGEFLVGVLSNRQLWRAVGEILEDVFDD